jgi:hypothetical protein
VKKVRGEDADSVLAQLLSHRSFKVAPYVREAVGSR